MADESHGDEPKSGVIEIDHSVLADAPEAQGDELKEGQVVEITLPNQATISAGELRDKGYRVPDEVDDDDVPPTYSADVVVGATDESGEPTDKAVQLVDTTVIDSDNSSANNFANSQAKQSKDKPAQDKPTPDHARSGLTVPDSGAKQ